MDKILSLLFWTVLRILDGVKDGDLGTKISSISGAHRKRKWKEEENEEEEQVEEESNDLDTSSDEAEDDNEIAEKNESTDATTSSQENKQEVMEEKHCVEKGENEKMTSSNEKIQSKKPSQPAVFVPVDRSPEIQVRACAWSLYLLFNSNTVTQTVHSYQNDLSNSCCRRLDSSCLCCQRSRSSWRRSEKIPVSSYVERQEVERPPKSLSFSMKLAMLRRLSSFVIGYLPLDPDNYSFVIRDYWHFRHFIVPTATMVSSVSQSQGEWLLSACPTEWPKR